MTRASLLLSCRGKGYFISIRSRYGPSGSRVLGAAPTRRRGSWAGRSGRRRRVHRRVRVTRKRGYRNQKLGVRTERPVGGNAVITGGLLRRRIAGGGHQGGCIGAGGDLFKVAGADA